MAEQSIVSTDMTLKRLFQDFYRVPDYQREYVWGETNPKGEGGEEVDQFLADIFTEYENAIQHFAPEYFVGTIVVCKGEDDVFELVDGQQRTTTSFLTICAIRDALVDLGAPVPEELKTQIAASSVDWQGATTRRLRLDLQYEDAKGILEAYAAGEAASAKRDGTRSIRNIGNAYDKVRDFLRASFKDDAVQITRFYGYLVNKVKVIRIETPTIAKALKIFETINDRGVGLDAMDLLKNLLFMNASPDDFTKLKARWKELTDALYQAGEKPLRFLRYYLLATYDLDSNLREDGIYDWFQKNASLTGHAEAPLKFADELLAAAKAYANFASGRNANGGVEPGVANTQILGGRAIKQHFILLLAGRKLSAANFTRLADETEKTMFVWLITGTPGKAYERRIVDAAHRLSKAGDAGFDEFVAAFSSERNDLSLDFSLSIFGLHTYDTRLFRLKYVLAKLTQHVDLLAYGPSEGRNNLADYTAGSNDIEHILAAGADAEAAAEFGEGATDRDIVQSLGNLLLLESSINRAISNQKYSYKAPIYASSKFLLTRCQGSKDGQEVGVADRITKTVQRLQSFPDWNIQAVQSRKDYLTGLAHEVWDVAPHYKPQSAP